MIGSRLSDPVRTMTIDYLLEALYEHQDRNWVVDAVPHLLAWVHRAADPQDLQPVVFAMRVARTSGAEPEVLELALRWRVEALEQHDRGLREKVDRLRRGHTVDRERVAETAAYGFALVAISVLMPGRRVVGMQKMAAPDFLFDDAPTALRGVEVAGRTSGGFAALRAVRAEKTPRLIADARIVEAHLSLWCVDPRVSELCMVKP
jgi:hypothetical protein